jgi:hypothetical protein
VAVTAAPGCPRVEVIVGLRERDATDVFEFGHEFAAMPACSGEVYAALRAFRGTLSRSGGLI